MKGALLTKENFAVKVALMTRKATFVAATKSHSHMARLIRSPKNGRLYKRKTVVHRSSAPGEAPANDTGNLLSSISHVQNEDRNGVVSSIVKVKALYGKWLEYGTSKMAERPFVRPTKEYIEPIFKEYIISRLRKMNKDGTVA
jgi:HK97 gp10 family phage protein